MTYNVFGGTLNLAQSKTQHCCLRCVTLTLFVSKSYIPPSLIVNEDYEQLVACLLICKVWYNVVLIQFCML